MDNRNDIRTRIEGNIPNIYSRLSPDSTHDLSNMNNSTIDKNIKIVVLRFTHQEFVELLQVNDYKRSEGARPGLLSRQYTSFVPGVWQQVISEKLSGQKITHGFNFKTHKISHYTKTASFKAQCNCGSVLNGKFQEITSDVISVECKIRSGIGRPCGKRYCRAPERQKIGKALVEKKKCVGVFRAEKADEMMDVNDLEPPNLYSANVLRVVKSEFKQKGRMHKEVEKCVHQY